MRLKQNSTTAIVVRKSWADLKAIQLFLRDCACDEAQSFDDCYASDDSHVIFARVLDDTDERGLWIELHTRDHEKDPTVELDALMIPWCAVLGVVIADNFTPAMEKGEKLGLSLSTQSE